jgi:hypothetical protein
MTIEGSSIYEPQVMALMKELEASGILLIVLNGKKAQRPITFASALRFPDIIKAIEACHIVAEEMRKDLYRILNNEEAKGIKARPVDED